MHTRYLVFLAIHRYCLRDNKQFAYKVGIVGRTVFVLCHNSSRIIIIVQSVVHAIDADRHFHDVEVLPLVGSSI